jgi:hypothetical protein
MNESTLARLKVLVERVVRPVQASTSRQQKMREELLAHVTAVFDEEFASSGAESLALERTEQRFGNPVELTDQIQESVPPVDRWDRFFEGVFAGGPGTGVPSLRLAFRYGLFALLPVAFLLVVAFVRDQVPAWPVLAVWPALSFVVVFLAVLLLDRMREALYGPEGRSWRKVALVAGASWLLIPCVTFASCLVLSGDWQASLLDVVPLIPAALVIPAALLGFARPFAASARQRQEWANIQIAGAMSDARGR